MICLTAIFILIDVALIVNPSYAFIPLRSHGLIGPAVPSNSLLLSSVSSTSNDELKVAIIGAGPSGLLLAHRLISSPLPVSTLDIYESRSDPRKESNLDGRAYALGLGIRGRTAIKSVDEKLWQSVKSRGFECDRFRLHINDRFNVKLRDTETGVEPSVLIYQTDLCGALLDELNKRSEETSVTLNVQYGKEVSHVNLTSSQITFRDNPEHKVYDLVIGSDGANSIVRAAIEIYSPPFTATQRKLPGFFKVARVNKMPPKLDPASVALILPKKGGVTAFVEPTVGGGGCILFAGRTIKAPTDGEEIDIGSALFGDVSVSADQVESMITEIYPLLENTPGLSEAVKTLLSQRNGVADSVKCNVYHSKPSTTPAAIIGDAAHATGGVSGQGCNSALLDAMVLADCLAEYNSISGTNNEVKLHQCLQSYSTKQVPEGLALYDLSFGNDGKTLPIFRSISSMLSTVIDTLFRGRWGIGKKPLQTLLASSSTSFVDIRRERNKYFVDEFPNDVELHDNLTTIYK